MSKIICIYPDDCSTRFLDRIQYRLKRELNEQFHCYKVKPNQPSHDRCLERLCNNAEEELVIFLGHGRSDCLFGATSYSRLLGSAYWEAADDYENENFINRDNVGVFSGKKVFCLSCNSAERIGKLAYQQGAKAFIGFGDIPTEEAVLEGMGTRLRSFTARFKGELGWIVKTSLVHSIKKNHNFFQLYDTVQLFTNVSINSIILTHINLRERRVLADYLYKFSSEMKLFGDGKEPLLSQSLTT
jgi:hypothetical protein